MPAPVRDRLLHIAPIAPAATGNGLAMRTSMFTEALASLGPADLIVVGDQPSGRSDWTANGVATSHLSISGRLDTRLRLIPMIKDGAARAAALRAYGRPSTTAILSAPVLRDAAAMLAEGRWSGIVFSRAYLLPLLDALPAALAETPVVADLDDDDGALCRQHAEIARGEGRAGLAAWLEAEADAYDRLIREHAKRVALFTCAGETACASIRARLELTALASVPNGIAVPALRSDPVASPDLLFVGNLNYPPNVDGVCWFVDSVWPALRAALPDVRLAVVGSNPAEAIRVACRAPQVTLHADPEDLSPYYRRAAAAIVPLRIGSGSRIKLLEAGAFGVPVTSTFVGAEGIDLEPEQHLFVSDCRAESFAEACLRCLGERPEARSRADRLLALVERNYRRDRVVQSIAAKVRCIAGPR
jgi:polysaccharide biosynthesis protein PslH